MKFLDNISRQVFLLILASLMMCGCDKILSPKAYLFNEAARENLKKERIQEVQEPLLEALSLAPFQSELHLNFGLMQELLKDNVKALESYRNSEKFAESPSRKFFAFYNQGEVLAREKKIDEALAAYQSALTYNPQSRETKHNIELLIQLQRQGGGSGESQNQDKNNDKNQDKNKDPKKDQKKGQSDDKKDNGKNDKDNEKPNEKNQPDQGENGGKDRDEKKDKDLNRKYADNPGRGKPQPFKAEELSEGDVKKILGELKQQEQKIRANFNRKQVKEQPNAKDW